MTTSVRLDDGTNTLWLRPAAPTAADAFLCDTHTLTSAAPRVVTDPWPGQSGMNDLTEFADGAAFTAHMFIQDAAGRTRHQWVDVLRAMLHPRNRPYLYIQRDGWLGERRAAVRGGGSAVAGAVTGTSSLMLEVSLQVEIPSGVLASATRSSDSMRPSAGSVGRAYTRIDPWSYTPGSSGAVKNVVAGGGEDGAVPTPLLMRLYGACTNPTITNVTAGKVLALTANGGLNLADGQYIEIDMGAKTVRLNGDPALSYYQTIDFSQSAWWQLLPGTNQLSVSAVTLDTSCELDLFWFNQFAI